MKSFRLHIQSRSDLLQSLLGFLIGSAAVLILLYAPIPSQLAQTLLLLAAAIITGYLIRSYPARALRRRYPNARMLPLLTIGLSICAAAAFFQFFLLPQSPTLMLAFYLPAFTFIAAFIFINRRDPDVMK